MNFIKKLKRIVPHRNKSKLEHCVEILLGWILSFAFLWIVLPKYKLPFQILCAIPCALFILYIIFSDGETLETLGAKFTKNWQKSCMIVFVFTVISIPIALIFWSRFFSWNHYFYKDYYFWRALLLYPPLAFLQQCFFMALVFNKYNKLFPQEKYMAVIFTAITFSVFHFPNPPLMIFCLFAGLVWAWAFSVSPNLYTITVSHVILGTFIITVLWVYYEIGPFAEPLRWSLAAGN